MKILMPSIPVAAFAIATFSVFLVVACQSTPAERAAKQLQAGASTTTIDGIKPTTLAEFAADLLKPAALAPATLAPSESTWPEPRIDDGILRTARITQDPGDPRFAFEVFGFTRDKVYALNEINCVAIVHLDGSVTVFDLRAWHSVQQVATGYKVWYAGQAVNCTCYIMAGEKMVRLNSVYNLGDEPHHDKVLGEIMRFLPLVYDSGTPPPTTVSVPVIWPDGTIPVAMPHFMLACPAYSIFETPRIVATNPNPR